MTTSLKTALRTRVLFCNRTSARAAIYGSYYPTASHSSTSISKKYSGTLHNAARVKSSDDAKVEAGRINLEEIARRVNRQRPRPDFRFSTGPTETEEVRETRLNSHPYRRLYPWESKEKLAAYLSHQIIHAKDGVIAINKPYGVGARNVYQQQQDKLEMLRRSGKELPKFHSDDDPFHHVRGTGFCDYTLEDVLPLLRTKLSMPDLELQKSTDKFTSGVALFSTNTKTGEKIRKCIESNKPNRIQTFSFLVISTNTSKKFLPISRTLSERVGIRLAENPVTKTAHPIIVRDFSKREVKQRQDIKPVSVSLTLVDTNPKLNMCLSRLDTSTTHNNFVRVYYANIVATVLGDHLYGSRVASVGGVIVPVPPAVARIGVGHQALTTEVITTLRLKQLQDSLVIPLHAHMEQLTLGNFYGAGNHLQIKAPLSDLFTWTCQRLTLSLKEHVPIINPET